MLTSRELISPESNDGTDNEDDKDDEQGKDGEHHQHSGIQLVVMVLTSRLLFGSYLATWQSMFTLSSDDQLYNQYQFLVTLCLPIIST